MHTHHYKQYWNVVYQSKNKSSEILQGNSHRNKNKILPFWEHTGLTKLKESFIPYSCNDHHMWPEPMNELTKKQKHKMS